MFRVGGLLDIMDFQRDMAFARPGSLFVVCIHKIGHSIVYSRDFNNMLSFEDRRGLNPHSAWLLRGFGQTISECNLFEIPLHGH